MAAAVSWLIAEAERRCLLHLDVIDTLKDALLAIGGEGPPEPRYDQDWFPPLDAAAAYAFVRRLKPRQILEIGCGHSTRFFMRAGRDQGFQPRLVGIDPAVRAARKVAGLPLTHLAEPLSVLHAPLFHALEPGDIASLDGSHKMTLHGDAAIFLNEILPGLKPGVLIHVHDIFLPFSYPPDWAWRGYDEQARVQEVLAAGGYQVEFASHYVSRVCAARVSRSVVAALPQASRAPAASLWFSRRR
ncbi:MAG: class I SAM-dependent methyltransferase [Alphaproteobacteria bacterium]|nr:class I SAM-dependent methyltransferase [Alphaproteobacteria bacterium]